MFKKNGFTLQSGVIDSSTIDAIKSELDSLPESMPAHGLRNAEKKLKSINKLASSKDILSLASRYLTGEPALVRAIVFDKTPDKNWLVTWHQDKTISVNRRTNIDGWVQWSLKDNIHHVQPDTTVLNDMVTLRIHLDNATATNGCLKVIAGSHLSGILKQNQIDDIAANSNHIECKAKAGDILIMHPLIVHASSKGSEPSHRRIVHLEYSSYVLPKGLRWI